MRKRGFATLTIIVVVAVVLLAGGMWYYESHQSQSAQTYQSNTPSVGSVAESNVINSTTPENASSNITLNTSTSNWLTYADSQDGFSFQYPPDYQINTITEDPFSINTSTYGIIGIGTGNLDAFEIRVLHKAPSQTMLNFWESASGMSIISSTPMKVNGYAVLEIEEQEPELVGSEGGNGVVYTSDELITNNNALVLDFTPSPFDAADHHHTMNQPPYLIPEEVLNTLRFKWQASINRDLQPVHSFL